MDEGKPPAKTIAEVTKNGLHQRSTLVLSPHKRMIRYEASGRSALEEVLPFPHLRQTDDDTPGLVILCKIAHTCTKVARPVMAATGQSALANRRK